MTVSTGIFKEPVTGGVRIEKLNLVGDRQADLTVHGGAEKAVYAYPAEHYEYWRRKLPEVELGWGKFGENLTTEGVDEGSVHIGDRMKIGSAVLILTQPRLPCYKLALRFERDDMIKRFLVSRRTGFYFSVLEPGEIHAGAAVEILERDANHVSVAEITQLFLGMRSEQELLDRALRTEALPQSFKSELQLRTGASSGIR